MSSMMLTELPAEIMGLTVGSKYLIQNKSVADVFLCERASMPTANEQDAYLLSGRGVAKSSEVAFVLKAGNKLYGWTVSGEAALFWNEFS